MVYTEKQIPNLVDGKWIQQQYDYSNESMLGHPLAARQVELTQEQVSSDYPFLVNPAKPSQKTFPTGEIHAVFNPGSVEYKTFVSDPRTRELSNQYIELSVQGIEFRKGVIAALEEEGVIPESISIAITNVYDSWASEVSA